MKDTTKISSAVILIYISYRKQEYLREYKSRGELRIYNFEAKMSLH